MVAPLTPLDFLARSGYAYRDMTAVVDGERRFTYAEFQARAHRLASALRGLGVAAGDRVAVLASNGVAALEAHFGPMLIGAVLVMLNTRLGRQELREILQHSGAKVLLVDPSLESLVEGEPLKHIIADYEALLAAGGAPLADPHLAAENDCIAINYTSGTTGAPKGVMYTHRGAWVNAVGEIVEHGLDQRSVYLWTLPMFHCNGWCFPWAVTAAGGRHVCMPRPDPAEAVRLIEAEGVTHLCGAPVVAAGLAEYCAQKGIRFAHRLKIVTAGAAASGSAPRGRTNRRGDRPRLRPH